MNIFIKQLKNIQKGKSKDPKHYITFKVTKENIDFTLLKDLLNVSLDSNKKSVNEELSIKCLTTNKESYDGCFNYVYVYYKNILEHIAKNLSNNTMYITISINWAKGIELLRYYGKQNYNISDISKRMLLTSTNLGPTIQISFEGESTSSLNTIYTNVVDLNEISLTYYKEYIKYFLTQKIDSKILKSVDNEISKKLVSALINK